MQKAFVFSGIILMLFSSCKKEEAFISPECRNPVIYQKFDNARALVIGVLDARLNDYANTGHCDNCYDTELILANQEVYSIGELYEQTSTCYNVYHLYQSYCYKMITGSQFISNQTDSAELAVQKLKYEAQFGRILNYVKSLQ
ncbi:MAG: hypothetical protein KIS94_12700 [Chitinophagales bacterium]|nr:hypothetical protein [Chitinophagales bacterium]